jgi:hypothetical protein
MTATLGANRFHSSDAKKPAMMSRERVLTAVTARARRTRKRTSHGPTMGMRRISATSDECEVKTCGVPVTSAASPHATPCGMNQWE